MPTVLYDLFPAHVAVAAADHPTQLTELRSSPPTPGAAYIDTARVIVTTDRILIAKDGPTGPIPVFSQPYVPGSFIKSAFRGEDSYLTAANGTKLVFKKNEGCGCGSRLRSWNPYPTLNSKNDPTE